MPQFIYLVTNSINDKKYVGQTNRTIEKRWSEHIRAGNYVGTKSLLSKAIKKYGVDKFKIEIIKTLETTDQSEIDKTEVYFIKEYNALTPNGYNVLNGGKGCFLTPEGKEYLKRTMTSRWQNKSYRASMLGSTLISARLKNNTSEAKLKRGNSLVRNRRYLITTPDGIEYCTYGVTHLQQLDLDVSSLIKVARNKMTNHKGYKVKSLNDDYVTVDKTYLDYVNKYECISLNKDNYSFCSYGIDAIKEQLKLDICQKTISHHINNANLINGYQVRDINAEPIIKQYLPDAERLIFTTPEGIQFCRYGMEGLKEETGLHRNAIYPLMNTNSRVYGRTHKGWSCVRVNESQVERDKLLTEKATKLAATKLQIKEDRKWWLVAKKKYLLTNLITNEQLCCYGLVHLRESHGLDGSCLIKVIKGKIKHHKNWTCIKIEN
jgi:group I intron endonuclease